MERDRINYSLLSQVLSFFLKLISGGFKIKL